MPLGSKARQRRRRDLARAYILSGRVHCPDCSKPMYFPGFMSAKTFAELTGVPARHAYKYHGISLDHIWPVSRGGTDDIENLRLCCRLCNFRKGHASIYEVPPARRRDASMCSAA